MYNEYGNGNDPLLVKRLFTLQFIRTVCPKNILFQPNAINFVT